MGNTIRYHNNKLCMRLSFDTFDRKFKNNFNHVGSFEFYTIYCFDINTELTLAVFKFHSERKGLCWEYTFQDTENNFHCVYLFIYFKLKYPHRANPRSFVLYNYIQYTSFLQVYIGYWIYILWPNDFILWILLRSTYRMSKTKNIG